MKTVRLFVTTILVLLSCSSVFAQNHELKGVVTDAETGEPIPFASVLLKGTKIGVACDEEGVYNIVVPIGKDNVVIFSSIGYQRQEIPVGKNLMLDVALETDVNALQETMVVAFGTSTKESFTGSAKVVKSSDIAKTQSSDVSRALEGVVPGVQMTTASGTLGSSPTIVIRGVSSINAGTDPLVIVDGVPYPGDLNNLNTADIESMTVLKDAASNALYGSRGANGVIIITTKSAKSRDAVVNLDIKLGWNSKALQEYDYIRDPREYMEMHYKALNNYFVASGASALDAHRLSNMVLPMSQSKGGLGYNVFTWDEEHEYLIGADGKMNPNATIGRMVEHKGQQYWVAPDDWMDLVYQSSLRQEYNLSVNGRTEKGAFYASLGFLDNDGIVKGNSMERFTARLKADYQAKKWLKVGANAAYTHFGYKNGNSNEGSGNSTANVFAFASAIAPIYPLYIRDANKNILVDENGYQVCDYGDGTINGLTRPVFAKSNAYQDAWLNVNDNEGNAFNGTAFADITFLKDFKFSLNAGVSLEEARGTSLNNPYYGQFATDGGILNKSHARSMRINFQQLLTYDKTFGKHHINAMIGHENYLSQSWILSAGKKQIFSMNNLELDGAIIDTQHASSNYASYNNEGYFLRAQYDYNNKIFTSVSYRRDASSRFHPDNRWGNFWSLGAGWLINHEPWFNASWVDMLKLKASVGSQGNDNIGDYKYTDMYQLTNNEDKVGVVYAHKGNKDITWETNTNVNVGVDFDFLNGKIGGSLEYFYRKTSDMLFFFTVPPSLGYGGYYDNIGDMRNAGVELSLTFNPIRKKNVNWNIYLNATHYTTKVLRLPEENKVINIEGYDGQIKGSTFLGEGLPLNTFYMENYAGVDPETGKSLWYKNTFKKDSEGKYMRDEQGKRIVDGKTTTSDYSDATKYLSGDPTPDLYGGFGTSVDFFGFDFSVQFTYQIGGLAYDGGYASLMSSPTKNTTGYNLHKDLYKAWTPQNKESDIPRFQLEDKFSAAFSNRFLTDASYLNIQNMQFGYTLPRKLTSKIAIQKLRLYVTCDNVWYWSRRKGMDPRQSLSGSTNDAMNSPVRTLSGGLSITF